jgi:sugar phosphate isomerase/epimerase
MFSLGFLTDGRVTDAAIARSEGYTCLELALFGESPVHHNWADFRRSLQNEGISLAAVSLFGQDYFGPEGVQRMALLEQTLELAANLGAPLLVFGTGASCPGPAAALERFAELREEAATMAMGVAFYNCHWENVVDRPDAWAQLPEDSGFGIKFDPSHPIQGGRDWRPELLATGKRLVHVHAKEVLRVGDAFLADPNPGLGDIRWEAFFGILYHLGFTGAVCVEPHSALYTGEHRERFLRLSKRYLDRFLI